MKNNYYVYNNEAIGCCVLISVLRQYGNMDYARVFLILPLLLDDKTVDFINRDNDFNFIKFLGKESMVYNFNARFLSLLPITINSLVILFNIKVIKIDVEGNISLINDSFRDSELSERLKNIEKIIPVFLEAIQPYSTEYLYKALGVQL